MQDAPTIREIFERMRGLGIHYEMELPRGLAAEYETLIERHVRHAVL